MYLYLDSKQYNIPSPALSSISQISLKTVNPMSISRLFLILLCYYYKKGCGIGIAIVIVVKFAANKT